MDATTTTTRPDPATLVESVRPWAHLLARRYANRRRRPDLADDLAGELLVRLLERAPKHDPARAAATTWAACVARTHLPVIFAEIAWAVRVPSWCAAAPGEARTGRTRAALAAAQTPPRRVAPRPRGPASRRGGRDAVEPLAPGADEAAEAAAGRAERDALVEAVRAAASPGAGVLDPRERLAVRGHYGLDGGPPRTFADLGAELGISKQGIQWIRNRAVRRLRDALAARPGEGRHE